MIKKGYICHLSKLPSFMNRTVLIWCADNFRALTRMLSRKDLLPMILLLSAKVFSAKITRSSLVREVVRAGLAFALALLIVACGENTKSRTAEEEGAPEAPFQEFADFYDRFHQDSVFQMERTLFPLPGLPREADRALIASGRYRWTPETWTLQRPINLQKSNFKRELIPVTKDLIIEKLVQPEYNLQIERRFSRLEDGWHLIYYAGLNNIPKE